MEVIVSLPSYGPVTFDVSPDLHGNAFFVLGVRKSGSTLFMQTCRALAGLNSVPFVDIAGTFFKSNIPVGDWIRSPLIKKVLYPGNAYGGFRSLPFNLADTACFRNARKVLLVRDPRDALVSEYFSTSYSHSVPSGGNTTGVRKELLDERQRALSSSIKEYVIRRAAPMCRTLSEYSALLSDPKTRILKYEEVIFDKQKLVSAILDQFGWYAPAPAISKLIGKIDIRPQQERPREFIRRVVPGDYREKLDSDTIIYLNGELNEALKLFGYI